MSCNNCQAKFSFFTKEVGCAKCGFSYCTKCLKYKVQLPVVGEKKICGRCYNKMQTVAKPVTATEDFSIPDGLDEPLAPIDITKKMESLENPARPPITMYRQGSKLDRLQVGLDPIDQEIVNRLKKLKDEDKQLPPPTEDEIRRRLALLQDQDPDFENQPVNIHQVDTRTDQEKTDDLIKEYLEILEISKASGEIDTDIQARLDNLRGIDSSKHKNDITDFEEDDDETATMKVIQKALAEATLEAKYGDVDELVDIETEQGAQCSKNTHHDDYVDTCVLCDQTANLVMCKGCTGDLYCPVCFEDNHDDFEMHKHTTVPFKPRKYSD
ncbi:abscission/NoCut checkpoint regulator isoform X1 [Nasonia vitripennis]|uniref:FYVE-type domain-containing protein n=1 Tax=Nasonia vitripennis TaxID=7425 RepID=A0A7M7G8V6_NASVI|nr:abscission/NoCut checkpoint regulator isoform X1 [Nasonia vitripennis]